MRRRRRKIRKIWRNDGLYNFLRNYVDWATRRIYSRIYTEGRENIPTDGLIVYAPNHCCTMMDPMVLLQDDKRPLAFGARADVFKKPSVARIMYFLKILPLSRERDGMAAVTENLDVFNNAVKCMENGVPFCMFAEGRHRPERGLQPLKKGVARIALQAAGTQEKPVYIVPVGLDYETFFDSMTGLTIRYGKAIRVEAEDNIRQIMQTLTENLESLIGRPPVTVPRLGIVLKALLFPIFAISFVLCWPILLATAILSRKLKDRAWINTIRYGCLFVGVVLLTLIEGIPALVLLPWYISLPLIVALWYSHSIFHYILNIYKK
ncbi:MAG: 1-acyl-sn-glycerol-3-phosphate acyltransferase [Bacteroidales bacterium]|nr:1-acyl-sn-glycerol-3-phosphate acyltransferase [Bacteroidales bacterium]